MFVFMPSPFDSVGKRIMFLGCLSAAFIRLFIIWSDLVTKMSYEQLEQSR